MVEIRRIRPCEGDKLRAIRLRAIGDSPWAFGSTLEETEARPDAYWVQRAADNATGIESIMFVAEDCGEWVGLVGGYVGYSDDTRYVDLISMWVAPGHRGRGLGQQLVEAVVEWARERRAVRVVLWVTQSNQPALSLYAQCGFARTGGSQPLPSNPTLQEYEMALSLN